MDLTLRQTLGTQGAWWVDSVVMVASVGSVPPQESDPAAELGVLPLGCSVESFFHGRSELSSSLASELVAISGLEVSPVLCGSSPCSRRGSHLV